MTLKEAIFFIYFWRFADFTTKIEEPATGWITLTENVTTWPVAIFCEKRG